MRKFYSRANLTTCSLYAFSLLLAMMSCNKPRYDLVDKTDDNNPSAKRRKVLFIGLSGVRGSAVQKAEIPNITKLLANSIFSFDALAEPPTWEETGWSSLLTGVSGKKHGVTGSSYAGNAFDKYPMIFTRIKQFNPQLKTVSVAAATSLNTFLVKDADVAESFENDDLAVKEEAIISLADTTSDVVLVDFKGVDIAGDQYGFDTTIPQYMQAISTVDAYVGELVAALNARNSIDREDWLIVVSSDHGGNLSGHGGSDYESQNIFTMFYNKNFNPNNITKPQTSTTFLKINQVDGLQYAYSNSDLYKLNKYPKFTFEMRVKIDGGLSSDPPLASNKDWGSGGNAGWGIFVSGQKWRFNVADGSGNRRDIAPSALPDLTDGKWHHIAVTVNKAGLAKSYQDGVFYGEINVSAVTTWDNTQPATLAILDDGTLKARNTWGYTVKANVADIRMWNAEIDPATLAAYAKCDTIITPDHPFYENLLGWWRGVDGKGDILKDYSLKNKNLTIFGAPKWEEVGKNLCGEVIQSEVPKTVDVAAQVYSWLRIPIKPEWGLDGRVWINN